MNFYRIPSEINSKDIRNKDFSLSASMYKRVIFNTQNIKKIEELLDANNLFDKGVEPGTQWYMKKSPNYLIRTKSIQKFSHLLYPKGDSIVPINPKVFCNMSLKKGDILISKDSNIGEVCIINDDSWKDYVFSGGIVRLNVDESKVDKYYLFSFLKNPIFKTQLYALSPKGATITHAGTKWLDCYIPFPKCKNSKQVEVYVSNLTKSIIDKEDKIRQKHNRITKIINDELLNNQQNKKFIYEEPHISEIINIGRLDSAIYGREYKEKIFIIENYKNGYITPSEAGFKVIPGPSLEIKILKTRIDSDVYKEGFYALILPTNISEYGTMNKLPYIGTGKKLPLLKQGDIVFGEAGFQKGRSIVLLEGIDNCTTNAHGLYARRDDGDITKSVFFRCIFDWYRKEGLIDLMAVGGSGGHFSPEYFDYIKIPKFDESKIKEISSLYHQNSDQPDMIINLENFVDYHRKWNESLGIYELDRELKILQKHLLDIQSKIINGEDIDIK